MSDEDYVIDICNRILGLAAKRQFTFEFLRGDPGKKERCAKLPVDAYYDTLKLVIEYRERQHTEAVPFFDRKQTLSGCGRAEQRRRYDQRRRDVLPKHGIVLIELEYDMFAHDGRKRLKKDAEADERVIRRLLSERVPARLAGPLSPKSFAAWRPHGIDSQAIGQAWLFGSVAAILLGLILVIDGLTSYWRSSEEALLGAILAAAGITGLWMGRRHGRF